MEEDPDSPVADTVATDAAANVTPFKFVFSACANSEKET